jgi:DNA-directed RNA polymerase specialized sigma24 family protein
MYLGTLYANYFSCAAGGVVGVVIIPFDYEQLPEDRRKKVVPICIEAEDRDGNLIDPVWFEQGVAPISVELIGLAQSVLGDKRMVSDIVQPSVHKVWYKHRHNAGNKPYARIWRQAIWEARDQAAGGWRERRFRVVSRTLDELDREFPERTTDPRDYTVLYHQQIVLHTVEATLEQEGLEEMAQVYESLRLGETWSEISTKLGQGGEALKRRFYRFRKRFRSTT